MGARLTVMIIRHAEKPAEPPPYGVTAEGEKNDGSLTVRGWQRAGALASLFAPGNDLFVSPQLARPTVIYASNPHDGSHRPLETVKPLAKKLGLAPVETYGKGDEVSLVRAVLRESGVVLVAWQHEKIVGIATELVADAPPQSAIPQQWPADRFDVVWIFTTAGAGRWTFAQVPQRLLGGDVNQPIT